jgi:hypothetical protein
MTFMIASFLLLAAPPSQDSRGQGDIDQMRETVASILSFNRDDSGLSLLRAGSLRINPAADRRLWTAAGYEFEFGEDSRLLSFLAPLAEPVEGKLLTADGREDVLRKLLALTGATQRAVDIQNHRSTRREASMAFRYLFDERVASTEWGIVQMNLDGRVTLLRMPVELDTRYARVPTISREHALRSATDAYRRHQPLPSSRLIGVERMLGRPLAGVGVVSELGQEVRELVAARIAIPLYRIAFGDGRSVQNVYVDARSGRPLAIATVNLMSGQQAANPPMPLEGLVKAGTVTQNVAIARTDTIAREKPARWPVIYEAGGVVYGGFLGDGGGIWLAEAGDTYRLYRIESGAMGELAEQTRRGEPFGRGHESDKGPPRSF